MSVGDRGACRPTALLGIHLALTAVTEGLKFRRSRRTVQLLTYLVARAGSAGQRALSERGTGERGRAPDQADRRPAIAERDQGRGYWEQVGVLDGCIRPPQQQILPASPICRGMAVDWVPAAGEGRMPWRKRSLPLLGRRRPGGCWSPRAKPRLRAQKGSERPSDGVRRGTRTRGGSRPELKEIWEFIQLQTQATQLWEALATAVAAGDPYKRADWLNSVADLKQPKAKAGAPPPASTGAGTATQVSTPPGAGGTPPAAPPVAKKASAFGRAKAAQDTPGQPATTAAGQTTASTAAAATTSAPPTEARKASPFAKKAAATADSTAVSPAAEPGAAATGPAATVAAQTSEQLRQSLSALADNPDVPLNAEDVDELLRDPDAAEKIAEAQAAIEAELEAELAAAQAET